MNMPKIIKKLTHKNIVDAPLRDKPYRLNDGDRLHVLVRPNGRKTWQVSYTLLGKKNTYTIGDFNPRLQAGHISLQEARGRRDEVIALARQGTDPNQQKASRQAQDKSADTFEDVARRWHKQGIWVERYKKRTLASLENDAFPLIGSQLIQNITRQDIVAVGERISKRGSKEAAKRVVKRCESILDFAIHHGICNENVAMGVTRFMESPQKKHRPFLKESQLPEFLYNLDRYHGHEYIRIAMQLQVIVFLRPSELRMAPWSEIDFDKKLWRIPAQRMKMRRDHVVPLSMQALALLGRLHEITGHGEYMFPAIHKAYQPISDTALLKVLRILGCVDDIKATVHGFRHTASTILNENAFNADAIEFQLAHAPKNQIRSTYNHAEYLGERSRIMQWYADHMDKLRESYVP